MNEYYDFFKDFAGVTEKDLQQYKCGGKTKKKACGGIKMKKMEDGSWFSKYKPSNIKKQIEWNDRKKHVIKSPQPGTEEYKKAIKEDERADRAEFEGMPKSNNVPSNTKKAKKK